MNLDRLQHPHQLIPMARKISPVSDARSLATWRKFLKKSRPDILVAGTPKASAISLAAAKSVGINRRVFVAHGAPWESNKGLKRQLLKLADTVSIASATDSIAVSKTLTELIGSQLGIKAQPKVLGNGSVCGVDTSKFQFRQPSLNRPVKKILYVGRINRDKNIDTLVKVFDRVRAKIPSELIVLGRIDDSAPADSSTMERLQYDPTIHWNGYCPNVAEIMQDADILLLPTGREGLPQVVLEAQSCGLPVAAWDATGVRDASSPVSRKILTRVGDIEGLSRSTELILSDNSLRCDLSIKGREWVENQFEQSHVANRFADYLTEHLSFM